MTDNQIKPNKDEIKSDRKKLIKSKKVVKK